MAKCKEMTMESILPFSQVTGDGLFLVEKVEGENITGKYRKPGGNPGDDEPIQKGKCKESGKKFEAERAGFRYEGDIFAFEGDDIVVIVGKRKVKQQAAKRKKDKEEVDNEEVWVGVKTST